MEYFHPTPNARRGQLRRTLLDLLRFAAYLLLAAGVVAAECCLLDWLTGRW